MRRTLILASFLLAVPSFAAAQHHGAMGGGGSLVVAVPHGMAPMGHPAARVATGTHAVAAPGVVHHVHVGGTVNHGVSVASGMRNLPLFPSDASNVPGLGFDYPHFAAANSAGQGFGRRHRFDRAGLGFGFGGFLLSPDVIVVEGQPGEGQPVVEETTAAQNAGAENDRDAADQFLPSAGAPAPLPRAAAEYVFVRRDGSLLFAVGYSWDNGTLRYVTRDGFRRSVTQDALDLGATQQFNEQRGLNFRMPA
jgi:hypothetical protein